MEIIKKTEAQLKEMALTIKNKYNLFGKLSDCLRVDYETDGNKGTSIFLAYFKVGTDVDHCKGTKFLKIDFCENGEYCISLLVKN